MRVRAQSKTFESFRRFGPLPAMAFLVVTLSVVGCGAPRDGDALDIEATASALQNNGYTTRTVCTACGCVATEVACNCGMPPSKRKLDCIDNGGPTAGTISLGTTATSGTSVGATVLQSR
jgi:hypothetical protein